MSDLQRDQRKDTDNNKEQSLSSINRFRTFFLNNYHTFLVEKSEKLASALYVITGFIHHDEPLRVRLRNSALDLIAHSCDASRFSGNGADQFASRCTEIGTILETAIRAGLISPMNAGILCDEYASLAHFVRRNHTNISERGFSQANGTPGTLSVKSSLDDVLNNDKRHINIGNGNGKKRQIDRRASILALFKNRDKISIRDATASVVGCSEKTIQRELLSLVQEGLLIKEGERRWTLYRKVS